MADNNCCCLHERITGDRKETIMKTMDGYMHGVNLGGWLSQCDHTKERYDTFIREEDIETISRRGLDHIRVPVDYDLVEDAEGNYLEEGFVYIQKAIDWCGKYGLNMVLDLHKTFGFSFDDGEEESGFFDNEEYQERFYRLWEQFAARYGKYGDRIAFELLNEVTEKEYSDSWNRISTECIKRIRKIAPDNKILLGGYYNNSIEALKDLAMPFDDNVVYNFHCYEPLIFTHQGAYWVHGMDTSFRMRIDSTYGEYSQHARKQLDHFFTDLDRFGKDRKFGAEFFEDLISEAVKVAKERNTALYCGEFGVIDLAEPEDTVEWYRMICSVFDKYGIGRAAWSYREMDFGLSDERMKEAAETIIRLI